MQWGAVAVVVTVAGSLGLLIWRLSTMDTDPKGYTKIGELDVLEIQGARRILEKATIPALTDDHTFTASGGGCGGFVHLLVPTNRAQEAIQLLERERDSWAREAPPA
jgi:hypothetical protein